MPEAQKSEHAPERPDYDSSLTITITSPANVPSTQAASAPSEKACVVTTVAREEELVHTGYERRPVRAGRRKKQTTDVRQYGGNSRLERLIIVNTEIR